MGIELTGGATVTIYRWMWLLGWSGVAVAAALGLTGTSLGAVLALACCFLVSSPPCVRRYSRWLDSAPKPTTAQLDAVTTTLSWAAPGYVPVQPASGLWSLTDGELCARWQASCSSLREGSSVVSRVEAVDDRARLLDEVQRRDSAALNALLGSCAGATDELLPQLLGSTAGTATIDWDALVRPED
jgi:hypothetical protein